MILKHFLNTCTEIHLALSMRLEGFGYSCAERMIQLLTVKTPTNLLAGSTLIGPVSKVAKRTVLNSLLVAFTLTDEVEGNLHLLCESQGLDLDGLRFAFFRTALRGHTDAKCNLGVKE